MADTRTAVTPPRISGDAAQAIDPRPGHYYVSATEGRRFALLLGPYPTHQDALDQVDAGRLEAIARDRRAVWWAFGTSRLPPDYPNPPRGVLQQGLATAANPAATVEPA